MGEYGTTIWQVNAGHDFRSGWKTRTEFTRNTDKVVCIWDKTWFLVEFAVFEKSYPCRAKDIEKIVHNCSKLIYSEPVKEILIH